MKMAKNEPVFKVKIGNLSGSIFLNEVNKNGQTFEYPSVNFQKSFVKKDGDPKNKDDWMNPSISFSNASELDKAILVLTRIKEAIYDKNYTENQDS